MSDWVKVPETDWEVLRSMLGTLRTRAVAQGVGAIQSVLLRGGGEPEETLAEISREVKATENRVGRLFGRLTRHNCRAQLAAMLRAGLFCPEEIEAFTRKTRLWAEKVLEDERGEAPVPAAPPAAPGAAGPARGGERLDGYITPEGEYLPLDGLEAMERAFRRRFGGDGRKVVDGLRGVSLELARERRDEAARRFLERARALGGGASGEGPEMLRLGLAFEGIARYDLAGECYEYGRSLGECDPLPWYFLHNNHAYCLDMLERFAEAEPLARRAIDIAPGRHNAHKNLGLALMGQGRLREAAESFRTACDLCPTDGRAVRYLEALERRLGAGSAASAN